jgi:hypothetical protein
MPSRVPDGQIASSAFPTVSLRVEWEENYLLQTAAENNKAL